VLERVRELFQRAGGTFGHRPAKFFAESNQKCVVLVEKPGVLRQI